MTSDLRALAAREAHLAAEGHSRAAAQARAKRDRLIRQLRAEDPKRWTLATLAALLGVSRAAVQKIVDVPEGPAGR